MRQLYGVFLKKTFNHWKANVLLGLLHRPISSWAWSLKRYSFDLGHLSTKNAILKKKLSTKNQQGVNLFF